MGQEDASNDRCLTIFSRQGENRSPGALWVVIDLPDKFELEFLELKWFAHILTLWGEYVISQKANDLICLAFSFHI